MVAEQLKLQLQKLLVLIYQANGYYWSATPRDASNVWNMNFNPSNVNGNNWNNPGNGFSARLFAEASALVTLISS